MTLVVDPHWFQCGSGCLFQCGSGCGSGYGYGSRKPNQCGSRGIRIRILVRLLSHKRNMLKVGNISQNIPTVRRYKSFFKKAFLFAKFGQFQCSWIRIRIPNTDPDSDPRQRNECGSTTLLMTEEKDARCFPYLELVQWSRSAEQKVRFHNTVTNGRKKIPLTCYSRPCWGADPTVWPWWTPPHCPGGDPSWRAPWTCCGAACWCNTCSNNSQYWPRTVYCV